MSATSSAPGLQQKRFAAYMDGLAQAAGHADRKAPLKNYCTGLLLPGERKSVEPMAARLAPGQVRRLHQSLHHLVADAPWSDEALLRQVRNYVLPRMEKKGPVVAWIVDDTGFPKKGSHSVGVTRQYCGQVGKQENCRVAVSLSVATWGSSLPIAWRLYLPESWTQDRKRRRRAGVPEEVEFQTKPQLALEQIRQALEEGVPRGVVVADAGYGIDSQFRTAVTGLGLKYVVGVQSSTTVWEPGRQPLPAPPAAPRSGTSARLGPAVGVGLAPFGLEGSALAPGKLASPALPFCGGARTSGPSRLLAGGAPSARVAAHRMAPRSSRAHQVLVFDPPR